MKKILLIEDNERNTLLVMRVLENHPFQLLTAPDGETGMAMAVAEEPDLLLVDMGLPDIDGQTLVNLLRRLPEVAQKPIVAVTAWPPSVAIDMAKRYGCDGCITKPIDIRQFPTQIAGYLEEKTENQTP